MPSRLLVPGLSLSLLISWGSLYYAFAVLAGPMRLALGCDADTMAGAFSLALLVWGVATYPVGVALHRWGGRVVMASGSLLAAVAFLGLYGVSALWAFYALWAMLGLAMALTLYEPAFAVIVQSFRADRRRRIGWLTIVGGLASTVFWPLSHYLSTQLGWRQTALVFAVLHLLVCLPVHLGLPRSRLAEDSQDSTSTEPAGGVADAEPMTTQHRSAFAQLGACFTIYGFITAAMAVQVIPALQSRGLDAANALSLAACIGPMQAAGRALDLAMGNRMDARRVGILTLSLMPLSLAALWLAQWRPELCLVFVIAYGLGLGLMTVVKATAPLDLFGARRYARNSGVLGAPAVIARAAGPIGAAWLLSAFNGHGPVLLVLLAASVVGTWLFLRVWPRAGEAA
ncbi:MFS transporter [Azohydromonas caseinilytica]|uniref:MFS transporter n=1 Tax=Azohydromonas caseinilytica TaxID=2728836 RepID=A0A848FDW2_9BURK|nr:MFS transporter [Azohydromonas caseinilytica]NML16081.1 MFS transporter [Azohydromonas caseinilytica]